MNDAVVVVQKQP